MFKSVFAKYISAFMAIFLISFTLLGAVIGIMVSDYAMDEKHTSIENATENVKEMLSSAYYDYLESHRDGDFNTFIQNEKDTIARSISAVSDYSDFQIFIVNAEGLICIVDNNSGTLKGYIPERARQATLTRYGEGRLSEMGTMDGLFGSSRLIYGVKLGINLSTGVPAGAVFACSSSTELSSFVSSMISTILTACIIVMVIGLVACYIISERITTPIRNMSRAAKNFASGDFSVRVPVHGKDEIAELAQAFNQMAESLENLEELRSSFIANVAHDLRTPMTSISGFIDGILDGVIPPDKYHHYLSIVGTEVKRLSRLVATLLDISRIQAGERKFNMVNFDVCDMALQILLSFEKKIDEKQLQIQFETDKESMTVSADTDAIHQVLYNLIDNAVKFSYTKGILRVKLSYIDKEQRVTVSVYNEGQGMTPTDLAHVFDRFYKADKSRGLDKSGVGLGMYIVKTIISSHGETISVDSVEGKWCEFHFTLPVKTSIPPPKT